MSLKTNRVMTRTPTNSQPCGKQTSAPAETPRVPTPVTGLGLTPIRSRRLPRGAQTPVQNWRKRSSMAGAGERAPRSLLTERAPEPTLLTMLDVPNIDRKSRRRDQTRREILDAAWEVAREQGLTALTLRDVADRVGMRAPSLYSHFDSKHAI